MLSTAGCTESSTPTTQQQVPETTETKAEICRRKLSAGIKRVRPEALAMSAQPERAVNGLNSWISTCEGNNLAALQLSDDTLAMLPEAKLATARRFTANDAGFICNSLILRDLTNSLATVLRQESRSSHFDSSRLCRDVFDWVVNNVGLLATDQQRPAINLFDTLMLGEGSVDDRIWAYATAMRQQRIDVFLVTTDATPADAANTDVADSDQSNSDEGATGESSTDETQPGAASRLDSATQLIVVLLPDTSLVLDPLAGIPIFADPNTLPTTSTPITAAELIQHPRWAASKLLVVGESPLYSPRMLILQQQLAAEDAAILYSELNGDLSDITPVLQRINKGFDGIWPLERISVWEYPDQQIAASSSMTDEERRVYQELMKPFDAPFQAKTFSLPKNMQLATVPESLSLQEQEELKQQQLMQNFLEMMDSDAIFGKASRLLLKARLKQLAGSRETAIVQQLQQVRTAAMVEDIRINVPSKLRQEQGLPAVISRPVPQVVKDVNFSAIGDAMFWSGENQMNRLEFGTAALAFNNYRLQFPNGRRRFATLIKEAMAMLKQDSKAAAIKLLQQADTPDNPEIVRTQTWLRILQQQ